jgi:hypothetical protein
MVLVLLNSSTTFDLFLLEEESLTQNDLLRLSQYNSPFNTTQVPQLSQEDIYWLGLKLAGHKVDHCGPQMRLPNDIISTYLLAICPHAVDTTKPCDDSNNGHGDEKNNRFLSPFLSPQDVCQGFDQKIDAKSKQNGDDKSQNDAQDVKSGSNLTSNLTSKPSKPYVVEPKYVLDKPVFNPARVDHFISAIFFIPWNLSG